jgi:hypothetical protein
MMIPMLRSFRMAQSLFVLAAFMALGACGPGESAPAGDAPLECGVSRAGNTQACGTTWSCGENRYSVSCTTNGTDYDCNCDENGVASGTFVHADYCVDTSTGSQKAATETGCGFELVKK